MNQTETIEEVELDRNRFKEVFFKYVSYWKWFVLSIFSCVSGGFLLHRYQVPQYIA
jgi:hypothetical protein